MVRHAYRPCPYIRQEDIADRLTAVIKPIQISAEVADDIAKAIRSSGQDARNGVAPKRSGSSISVSGRSPQS